MSLSVNMCDWVYPVFTKFKSDACTALDEMVEVAAFYGWQIKTLSLDFDSSFRATTFLKYCGERKILPRFTLHSHQNHYAERAIWQGSKLASTFLVSAMLATIFWEYALRWSYWLRRKLVNPDHWHPDRRTMSPDELVKGEKPDVGITRVWGCTVIPIDPKISAGSMLDAGSRVVPGNWIFVGHPGRETEHIKGWLCYNLEEAFPKGERVFYHVWFLESMEHRFDSLTRFDKDLLDRGSSPGQKLSRYERLANKVRGMYRQSTDLESAGSVTIDDFELTFAKFTDTPVSEGSQPSIMTDQVRDSDSQEHHSATAEPDHSLLLLQQMINDTRNTHQVTPTFRKVDQRHTGHGVMMADNEAALSSVEWPQYFYPPLREIQLLLHFWLTGQDSNLNT